jgi:RNA-binding protein
MPLSEPQKKFLRGKAHGLDPVVMVGNAGLSEGVVREADRALEDHELIKIRVRAADRGNRDAMIAQLAQRTGSELVHRIGHVAALYRARREEPRMLIPD